MNRDMATTGNTGKFAWVQDTDKGHNTDIGRNEIKAPEATDINITQNGTLDTSGNNKMPDTVLNTDRTDAPVTQTDTNVKTPGLLSMAPDITDDDNDAKADKYNEKALAKNMARQQEYLNKANKALDRERNTGRESGLSKALKTAGYTNAVESPANSPVPDMTKADLPMSPLINQVKQKAKATDAEIKRADDERKEKAAAWEKETRQKVNDEYNKNIRNYLNDARAWSDKNIDTTKRKGPYDTLPYSEMNPLSENSNKEALEDLSGDLIRAANENKDNKDEYKRLTDQSAAYYGLITINEALNDSGISKEDKELIKNVMSNPDAAPEEIADVKRILKDNGYAGVNRIPGDIELAHKEMNSIESTNQSVLEYGAFMGDTWETKVAEDGSKYTAINRKDGTGINKDMPEMPKELSTPVTSLPDKETVAPAELDNTKNSDGIDYTETQLKQRSGLKDNLNEINSLYKAGQYEKALFTANALQRNIFNAISSGSLDLDEQQKIYYSIKNIGAEYIKNTYPDLDMTNKRQQKLLKKDPALAATFNIECLNNAIKVNQTQKLIDQYYNGQITKNEYFTEAYKIAEGGKEAYNRLALEAVGEKDPRKTATLTEFGRQLAEDTISQLGIPDDNSTYDSRSKFNKVVNAFGYKTVELLSGTLKDAADSILTLGNMLTLGLLRDKINSAKNTVENMGPQPSKNLDAFISLYRSPAGTQLRRMGDIISGLQSVGTGLATISNPLVAAPFIESGLAAISNALAAAPFIKSGIKSLAPNGGAPDVIRDFYKGLAKDMGYKLDGDKPKVDIIQGEADIDRKADEPRKTSEASVSEMKKKKEDTLSDELEGTVTDDNYEGWNAGRGDKDRE